jgi:hypothetical protein
VHVAGQVFEQTPAVFSDNGTPIVTRIVTAWINPSLAGLQGTGIQGWARFYHLFLLGTYYDAHTLIVGAEFDYVESGFSNYPAIGAAQMGGVYQFRVDLLFKGQAIRFQIEDSFTGSGNQGFALSQMSVLLGVKPGGYKVPALVQV